jgi:hypothetical protein
MGPCLFRVSGHNQNIADKNSLLRRVAQRGGGWCKARQPKAEAEPTPAWVAGWVVGGTVLTVPGTVYSTPEENPRSGFIGGKRTVGTPGMPTFQAHTPLKPRGPGPT